MKKIIIIIVLIVMVITGFYLYTKNKTVTNSDGTKTSTGVSFKDFFPFSKPTTSNNDNKPVEPVPDYSIPKDTVPEKPKLKKIFDEPVAGITLITKDEPIEMPTDQNQTAPLTQPTPTNAKTKTPIKPLTQKVEYLRLVEKQNGHIDEIELKDYKVSKITDITIPKVQEALFGNNGSNVLMRYVNSDDNKTIRTYLANLVPDITSDTTNVSYIPFKLSGSFLPDNIETISISPSTNKLFYLFPYKEGMLGNILDLNTNKKIQNLATPFHNWLSQFVGEDSVLLTTKASARATGYSYLIDKTGNWNKMLGNIYGMTTNSSNDGQNLLISSYSNNGLILSILNTKTGATVRAPTNTLSEKCFWAKDNINLYCGIPDSIPQIDYPDSWYQGLVSFTDTIWKINQDGTGVSLTQLPNIDAVNIISNSDQSKLFLINNKDKSVWELDL